MQFLKSTKFGNRVRAPACRFQTLSLPLLCVCVCVCDTEMGAVWDMTYHIV